MARSTAILAIFWALRGSAMASSPSFALDDNDDATAARRPSEEPERGGVIGARLPDPLPPLYETNFSHFDDAAWALDDDCSSCGGHGGDECTRNNASAAAFDPANGMTITTTRLAESNQCGDVTSLSGHLTYKSALTFGDYTTVARFFPGGADDVNASTGFIGWISDGNVGSITIGFHGLGWDDEARVVNRRASSVIVALVGRPRLYATTRCARVNEPCDA